MMLHEDFRALVMAHIEGKPRPTTWREALEPWVTAIRAALHSRSHDTELRKLLSDCFNIYSDSLNVTSLDETLSTMAGEGCSSLEIAFSWMGRWRPTSAVFLVYSTMGSDGGTANSKGSSGTNEDSTHSLLLSEKQISALSALQKHVSRAEADLSQQVASFQMLLVEQNAVSALFLGGTDVAVGDLSNFRGLLDAKLKELQTLLVKADNLRLHTIKSLLDLLTPAQAASCCIVAYELLYALRSISQQATSACARP